MCPTPDGQDRSEVPEDQNPNNPDELSLVGDPEYNRWLVAAADRLEKGRNRAEAGEVEDTQKGNQHRHQRSGDDGLLPLVDHLAGQKTHREPDDDSQGTRWDGKVGGDHHGEGPEAEHEVEVDEDTDERSGPGGDQGITHPSQAHSFLTDANHGGGVVVDPA